MSNSTTKTCPECGAFLQYSNQILVCPKCLRTFHPQHYEQIIKIHKDIQAAENYGKKFRLFCNRPFYPKKGRFFRKTSEHCSLRCAGRDQPGRVLVMGGFFIIMGIIWFFQVFQVPTGFISLDLLAPLFLLIIGGLIIIYSIAGIG
jgi:hypothetical protein